MSSARTIWLLGEVGSFGGTRAFWNQIYSLFLASNEVDELRAITVQSSSERSMEATRGEAKNHKVLKSGWWLVNVLPSMRILRDVLKGSTDSDSVIISTGTPGFFVTPLARKNVVYYFLHTYPHGRIHRTIGYVFGFLIPKNWTVVTVSDFAAREIRRLWHLDRRGISVRVIRTGLKDEDLPAPDPRDSSAVEKAIEVLCVAGCEDYKDPFLWVQVAKMVEESGVGHIRFTWVGGGSQVEKMKALVSELGLDSNVQFVGSDEDPSRYYMRSHIYLQVSKVESLGLSLIEAAQHGLPSVITNTGGMPEVVEDGVSGIVCSSRDPREIAQAVQTLLTDSTLRQQLGDGARRRVEREFSYEKWSEQILGLLEHSD